MSNPLIIKLGGVLLDSEEALARLFDALLAYRNEHQRPLVIVHGGGCLVDELMKKLALPVKKKDGLRVTPADQIDIADECECRSGSDGAGSHYRSRSGAAL